MIRRRLWAILKASNKSLWSNIFLRVKVYIFWNFIQCTLHSDKTPRISFGQNKGYKEYTPYFASSNLWVLLLICGSCMSGNTRFISLKVCAGFSIFHSPLFLLKFIFVFVIITSKIKITEKSHNFLLPDLWFFRCNKKF